MELPVLDQARLRSAIMGLAQNPAASVPVLRKLMHIPGVAQHMCHRHGIIPDDLAEALLELSDPVIVYFLDHPNRLSPSIRRRLTDDLKPALRDAYHKHLRALVTTAQLSLPLYQLERLVGSTGLAAWTKLAEHSDHRIREAVARVCDDLPEGLRCTLFTDPDASVRFEACRCSRNPPADLRLRLLRDPATRQPVAASIALTPQLAAELASDRDARVRPWLATNPSLPESACEKLAARKEPRVWQGLICNPATPEPLRVQVCAQLAEAAQPSMKVPATSQLPSSQLSCADAFRQAAESLADAAYLGVGREAAVWDDLSRSDLRWPRELPLERVLIHLDSPCAFIRRALARRGDLPAEAIAQLDRDPDPHVRLVAAQRPNAPRDVLEQSVRECTVLEKRATQLLIDDIGLAVKHPNFPRAALVQFASAPQHQLRALACRHLDLSADDAARFLGDESPRVVFAAAAAPALPPAAVEHILANAAQFQG
jgi:hypothetical protein